MKHAHLLLSLFFTSFLCAMEQHVSPLQIQTYAYSVEGLKNEDRYVIKDIKHNGMHYFCTGIFDGHAGATVADLAQKKFFTFFEQKIKENSSVEDCLRYACEQCEILAKAQEYDSSGSTVLASCFNFNTNEMSVLWLGDSRAYISSEESAVWTKDHNCMNVQECQRVENAGGTIIDDKLNNIIAVTRSLGDAFAKTKISQLIFQPQCIILTLKNNAVEYSIEASDGFWNVVHKEVTDKIDDETENKINTYVWDAQRLSHKEFYETYPTKNFDDEENSLVSDEDNEDYEFNIARRLCYIAVEYLGSTDDTTVIVKLFEEHNTSCVFDDSIAMLQNLDFNEEEQSGDVSGSNDITPDESSGSYWSYCSEDEQFDQEQLICRLQNVQMERALKAQKEEYQQNLTTLNRRLDSLSTMIEKIESTMVEQKKENAELQQKNEVLNSRSGYFIGVSFCIGILLTIMVQYYYKYLQSHCVAG